MTGCRSLNLITLEAHLDLFLSQVQVVAPSHFQEALLWALGLVSLVSWGLVRPATAPFVG